MIAHECRPQEPAPTPEQIKKADEACILAHVTAQIGSLEPEDLMGTEALLAAHTPEQLAAFILVGERRALPAPEPLDATARSSKKHSNADCAKRRSRPSRLNTVQANNMTTTPMALTVYSWRLNSLISRFSLELVVEFP